ncbi:hypothetical protein GQ43DRAFT_87898 [Delitschia confertaspora ATCC 74209]|uniref:Protein kinase domain-containing protein n=1 Tax=Delitschia confertaspora ATCC 74209 TaxID=1513339 RepID=A0A9P4JKY8_9PLEO|nr:hypothetical protein GQ43DRAFT_87898 [Delitschia confertaspora ATCC 74209]
MCATWFSKYGVLPNDQHIEALSHLTLEPASAIRHWFGQMLKQGLSGHDSAYKSQSTLGQPNQFTNSTSDAQNSQEETSQHNFDHETTQTSTSRIVTSRGKTRCTPTSNPDLLGRNPNKIFQCTRKCGKRYGRKCDWKRNEEEGYPSKSWVCNLCRSQGVDRVKPCYRRYHFMQHFRNIHPGVNAADYEADSVVHSETEFPRRCGFCPKVFASRQERIDHIAEHFRTGKCMLDWNDDADDNNGSDNGGDDDDDQPDGDNFQDETFSGGTQHKGTANNHGSKREGGGGASGRYSYESNPSSTGQRYVPQCFPSKASGPVDLSSQCHSSQSVPNLTAAEMAAIDLGFVSGDAPLKYSIFTSYINQAPTPDSPLNASNDQLQCRNRADDLRSSSALETSSIKTEKAPITDLWRHQSNSDSQTSGMSENGEHVGSISCASTLDASAKRIPSNNSVDAQVKLLHCPVCLQVYAGGLFGKHNLRRHLAREHSGSAKVQKETSVVGLQSMINGINALERQSIKDEKDEKNLSHGPTTKQPTLDIYGSSTAQRMRAPNAQSTWACSKDVWRLQAQFRQQNGLNRFAECADGGCKHDEVALSTDPEMDRLSANQYLLLMQSESVDALGGLALMLQRLECLTSTPHQKNQTGWCSVTTRVRWQQILQMLRSLVGTKGDSVIEILGDSLKGTRQTQFIVRKGNGGERANMLLSQNEFRIRFPTSFVENMAARLPHQFLNCAGPVPDVSSSDFKDSGSPIVHTDGLSTFDKASAAHNNAASGISSLLEVATVQQERMTPNDVGTSAKFLSIKLLGTGGFSTVDEVIHRETNLRISRKTLKNRNRSAVEELRKEVEILQKLRHPHIVRFLGTYSRGDKVSILLSPVAETTLSVWLEKCMIRKPAGLTETIVNMYGCLASSVRYLHEQRPVIMHMDIKPENILVMQGDEEFPHVVLSDFGISQMEEEGREDVASKRLTRQYCAPEVGKSTSRGPKADIWSLGCVFLEMAIVALGQTNPLYHVFRKEFCGCAGKCYWQNIYRLHTWLLSFQTTATPWEKVILRTVSSMLRHDPETRPEASTLTIIFTPGRCCLSWPNQAASFPGSFEEQQLVETVISIEGGHDHANHLFGENNPCSGSDPSFNPKAWLRECSAEHQSCNHHESDTKSLPTRLLEIFSPELPESSVRLVTTTNATSFNEYAALSYNWTETSTTALTTSNVDSLLQGLPLDALPKEIKEAVAACIQLGLRYIWVDSLCVIQDSEEDRLRECCAMASVFRNAVVTIVSGNSSKPDSHIVIETGMQNVTGVIRSSSIATSTISSLSHNDLLSSLGAIYHPSSGDRTWDTRIWSFQERLLSKRLLHLTGEQMYWECCSLKASETFPKGLPPLLWEKVHSKQLDSGSYREGASTAPGKPMILLCGERRNEDVCRGKRGSEGTCRRKGGRKHKGEGKGSTKEDSRFPFRVEVPVPGKVVEDDEKSEKDTVMYGSGIV